LLQKLRVAGPGPDQPVPAELILGPQGRRPELFSRLFSRER
jgi:hypothetical protein